MQDYEIVILQDVLDPKLTWKDADGNASLVYKNAVTSRAPEARTK